MRALRTACSMVITGGGAGTLGPEGMSRPRYDPSVGDFRKGMGERVGDAGFVGLQSELMDRHASHPEARVVQHAVDQSVDDVKRQGMRLARLIRFTLDPCA